MLLTLLGWIWLISGIIFLLKPHWLRNKLKKKSLKAIRGWAFGLGLALGFLLVKATWGMPGWLPKLIFLLGLIAVFKGVFFLKARSAGRVVDWLVSQPVRVFRMFAVGQVVIGAVILSA